MSPKVGDHVKFKSPNGAFVSDGRVTRVEGEYFWAKNANGFESKNRISRIVSSGSKVGAVKTKDPGKLLIQRWAEDRDDDE